MDCHDNRISFGEAGRFGHNQYLLNAQGQKALQDVVSLILDAADSEEGRKWLKQVVIEGFTDTDGSYLYNLHLSLQRSEWVMCSLLDSRSPVQQGLSAGSSNRFARCSWPVACRSTVPEKLKKQADVLSCGCSSSG